MEESQPLSLAASRIPMVRSPRSLSDIAFVTRRRRCGQMRGRRSEADHRFTFHGSLLTFHGSWKRTEHDAVGRGSFAAVERSMSDRLLRVRNIHRGRGACRATLAKCQDDRIRRPAYVMVFPTTLPTAGRGRNCICRICSGRGSSCRSPDGIPRRDRIERPAQSA